jgi:simple sugar transport system permease protein
MSVFIALVIVAVIFVVLKWTRFGRNLYAVGGNSQSALTLGIDVKRTKFISYLICGFLSGIAGFLFLLKAGSGYAQHAMSFEMKAIASSIIGGVLLTGGVGNVVGAFFGVISMATITAVVNSAGLKEAFWQDIITGAMLGLAILLQGIILARRGKGGFRLPLPKWLASRKSP